LNIRQKGRLSFSYISREEKKGKRGGRSSTISIAREKKDREKRGKGVFSYKLI